TLDTLRQTTVFAQAEPLAVAQRPIAGFVAGHEITLPVWDSGLVKGQALLFSSPLAREIAHIADVSPSGDAATKVTLDHDLAFGYEREALRINANVARATHGETVADVLGSGDATQARQRFTLRQAPLTYTSSPTATGTASTLQVRVNDLLWHE